jgi:hypothetical protein
MNYKLSLWLIVIIDFFILSYQALQLSISYNEVEILHEHTFLSYIINFSLSLFGKNDLALRFPMIAMHLATVALLYQISKDYIRKDKDRVWLVLIYILLPGVISSALVVNSAGLLLFILYLFIFLFKRFPLYLSYILLFFMLGLDKHFVYLYLSLLIYSFFQKDKLFFIYNLLLFSLSYWLYGMKIDGMPSGHFLDTIGIYLAIFSPPLFIYIVYVLYRRYLQNQQEIIWYISSTLLLYAFMVSLRQRIDIEYIAPYLIVSLPIVANTFLDSYRIRLSLFRKNYKYLFLFSLSFLMLNSMVLIFNKEIYRFIDNPRKHFSYDMQIVRELSTMLKAKKINCVQTNKKLSKRLEFYGIKQCDTYKLDIVKDLKKDTDVTVRYSGRDVFKANVTKINNK